MDQAIVPYKIPQQKKPKANRKRPRIETEEDELDFNLWKIKKTLTTSDLNGLSRLIVPSEQVKTHVLPFMTLENQQSMELAKGVQVQILDLDIGKMHTLTFKKWKSKSYVLISNWNEFASSKDLCIGDTIGMTWEKDDQRFNFKVLQRAPRPPTTPPPPPPPPSNIMLFGREIKLELTLEVHGSSTNVISIDQNYGVIAAKPLQSRSEHNTSNAAATTTTTTVIRPKARRFKSVPQCEIDCALEEFAKTVKVVIEGRQTICNDVERMTENSQAGEDTQQLHKRGKLLHYCRSRDLNLSPSSEESEP